jgi:hypothetical protein
MEGINQWATVLTTDSKAMREKSARNIKQSCCAVELKRFGNPGIRTDHLLTA